MAVIQNADADADADECTDGAGTVGWSGDGDLHYGEVLR